MMSGKMYRFRPTDDFDPEFVQYWLMSPTAQRLIDAMKTGISDSGLNLTQDKFLKLPIPAPSLDEQRRLVNVLEETLSLVASAEQSLSSALLRTRAWKAASADSMIWKKGWPQSQIGDLLRQSMRNGRSDRAVRDGEPGTRTLTLTAITKNDFTDQNTKITTTSEAAARSLWLAPGDILVQRSNTPELVGTSALYTGERNWAIFPDLLIRLRADEQVIDSRFMAAALKTERAHRELRGRAKGLSGSMPKIDQSDLAQTQIPVPPRKEQAAVVAELESIERDAQAMMRGLETQRRRAKMMRASILETAFAGRMNMRCHPPLEEEGLDVQLSSLVMSDS
ncbi:restriction endonuclease subunit S [Arthrobacter sp. ISL-48]|uniref:restriction endonuclease subunit S n=1 Tax=Arthrobacter sp. ISL-48 TaxID=2819110 RepID=UPI001BE743A0|nr:restriction endonuclease subunit S [Arthrobacter sp. ISL-48]MBT2532911.1 restriction endonuclease subunit S [Arthrobacter sp. ISL-48]